MFHPDNVKNYHSSGNKVSVSIHEYWKKFGGAKGLSQLLRTDLKVRTEIAMDCFINIGVERNRWHRNRPLIENHAVWLIFHSFNFY